MRIFKLLIGTVIVFFAGNFLLTGFGFIFTPDRIQEQQAQQGMEDLVMSEVGIPFGIAFIVMGLIGVFCGIKFIRWVLKDA